MTTDYLFHVTQALAEQWQDSTPPIDCSNKDVIIATELLTEIALGTMVSKGENMSQLTSFHPTYGTINPGMTTDKIIDFVKEKAFTFTQIIDSGFPFSQIESSIAKTALIKTLNSSGSILSNFLTLDALETMSEDELTHRFEAAFTSISKEEVSSASFTLASRYLSQRNNHAGFYLLWLIKHTCGCSYIIPPKESFTDWTVKEVLSQFFLDPSSTMKDPVKCVHIMHTDRICFNFLDDKAIISFLNYLLKLLKNIPFDQWNEKVQLIHFLIIAQKNNRSFIAYALTQSEDKVTSEIGTHLLLLVQAGSLTEAIAPYYALKRHIPYFDWYRVAEMTGFPLVDFYHGMDDPDLTFAKRLNFNGMEKVFIHHSMMISLYYFPDGTIPPYLLAYDMNTEKLVWGVPINQNARLNETAEIYSPLCRPIYKVNFQIQQYSDYIILQFNDETRLHFIDASTGVIASTIDLPAPRGLYGKLHISPDRSYFYFDREKDLITGARIVNGKWVSTFEVKDARGQFLGLSTYCGLLHKKTLTLFGPSGTQTRIEHCRDAKAVDDKLYTIEKDPHHKESCYLTIRKLDNSQGIISAIQKRIRIETKKVTIGEVCKGQQCVLFSETSPIFVDLNTGGVIYSPYRSLISSQQIIDVETAEVWTWNLSSEKIWKISSTDIKPIGKLTRLQHRKLLHIDQNHRLYFADLNF